MKEGAITAADTKPIDDSSVAEGNGTSPKKGRMRLILLLSVPLIILAVGAYFYLTSGRYVSTDNAYV